jgi:hypothetical protein
VRKGQCKKEITELEYGSSPLPGDPEASGDKERGESELVNKYLKSRKIKIYETCKA